MKLLVLLSRVPYPLEKGDKLRAYHLMVRLARQHEIVLCCLSDGPTDPEHIAHLRQFCSHIEVIRIPKWRILLKLGTAIFSRLPFQVAYFHHASAQRVIDRIIREHKADHVLCQLVRTTEYVRAHPTLPKTLDYMDTLSKGMERRTRNAPVHLRPLLQAETRRLIRYENLMFDLFDNTVIISAQDREYLYHPLRDQVSVIPNGVDTEHFSPQVQEAKYDLVFTGNMNYPPNIDSVLFLVREVLPIVRRERPGTTLLISGVDPSTEVKDLARRDPGVVVSGWVKDIRSSYASARIFIAPMQIGTGLQNKLLEAMAMRMPCITSALANNAVRAKPGESILIGHTPTEYAEHILRLLGDTSERERLAEAGYKLVRDRFNWDRSAEDLEKLLLRTAG
ncbi:MAG: glycosyltransferase [Flavobacteriales bacterium]|nr:glycosyltransferase [Flavobacteriales bacterium]